MTIYLLELEIDWNVSDVYKTFFVIVVSLLLWLDVATSFAQHAQFLVVIRTECNDYTDSTFIEYWLNDNLPTAEALFKAGIAALLETPTTMIVDGKPKSSEPFVVQYVHNFLSNLVIVPVSGLVAVSKKLEGKWGFNDVNGASVLILTLWLPYCCFCILMNL